MHIEIDEGALRCTIWVDKEHSNDYKKDAAYQDAVKKSKAAGYSICVFVGGSSPLIPVAYDLLNAPKPLVA